MIKTKKFLTVNEREYLKTIHRNELDRYIADKIKAVLLDGDGWSYNQDFAS